MFTKTGAPVSGFILKAERAFAAWFDANRHAPLADMPIDVGLGVPNITLGAKQPVAGLIEKYCNAFPGWLATYRKRPVGSTTSEFGPGGVGTTPHASGTSVTVTGGMAQAET